MNARVCTTIAWLMAVSVLMCWAGTTAAAQVRQYDRTLGTIPSVGDTVWMYAHDRANSDDDNPDRYPAMAFAEGANLIFRLGYYDHVIAVDGRTGLEHGRVNITKLMQTSRSVTPEAVSCTRDGRLVLVKYRVRDTLHTILVSYPEGKLVRNFPFTPSREPRFDRNQTMISPDGRWVVAQSGVYELHDLQSGTKEEMRVVGFHFNDASTELIGSRGPDKSGLWTFAITDLTKGGKPWRSVNASPQLWNAKFSANGRYALAYTGPVTTTSVMQLPQLTVFDLMTGDTVWQITGTRIEDENINSDKDMLSYAISADGSLVYAYRDDTVAGTYLKGGYFYRMPDTIPIARSVVPGLSFKNEVFDSPNCDGGLSLWSPDLRRRFVSPRQGTVGYYPFTVMALDYDFTTGTGPDATTAGSTDAGARPVYPNPTTGTVTLPTSYDGPMAWSLWSTTASRIDGGQGMAAGGRLVITLPQSLPAGRYMLSVHPENRPSAIRSYTIVMN